MSFWTDRYPVESCRPSLTTNFPGADLAYEICLRRNRQVRLDGDKCRGYSIPSSSDLGFFLGSKSNWVDNVIAESIGFCRQWGSINIFVIFQTSVPMGSALDSNIGRPLDLWPGIGQGYRGPAIPSDDAVRIGLVSESDFQTFIGAHAGIRDQLSPSVIAKEKTAIEAHKSTVGKMEASDGARVSIGDTLSEIGDGFAKAIGNISGKLIGGIGSVLGQGVASALGSLGPVGVVVGVGLIATYAYKKTR